MTPLERNEERLRLMRAKYVKMSETPEAERSVELIDSLMALGDEIDTLEAKLDKQRKKASVSEDDAKEAARVAKSSMALFVIENDIYFIATSGLWYWREHGEWHSAKPGAFTEKFRAYLNSADSYKLFQQELDRTDRKVNAAHYAWKPKKGYLNLLSMDSFASATDANGYHPIFDLLFMSLGGGKQENIEHLERVIMSKWQHPENYLLPCVVFADGGGTGKSILVTKFLTTLFGQKNVADNLSMEMAFGKFNRSLAGKVIAFINEAPEDREDDKGILRVVHSPIINIEAKGRDPIEAANTSLYFLATNPKGGYAIRLARSDVDRRFSIIHGGKPLKWYVGEYYGLSHDNDDAAAYDKMVAELQHILTNPTEVGRWVFCKQREHGDIKQVSALHGADYQKQSADTEDMHTRVFDAIFQDDDFSHIRSDVLFKLYEGNRGSFKNIGFHRQAAIYLEAHPELNITYETGWPWSDASRPKARVYVKNAADRDTYWESGKRKKLANNDSKYISADERGRTTYLVDVI